MPCHEHEHELVRTLLSTRWVMVGICTHGRGGEEIGWWCVNAAGIINSHIIVWVIDWVILV